MQKIEGYGKKIGDRQKILAATKRQSGDSRISPDRRYADIRYWQQIGDSQETGEYQHIRDMQKIEGCKQKVVDRQKKQTGDSEEIRSK